MIYECKDKERTKGGRINGVNEFLTD